MNNLTVFDSQQDVNVERLCNKTSKCEQQIFHCLSDLRDVILNKIKDEVALSGTAYNSAYVDLRDAMKPKSQLNTQRYVLLAYLRFSGSQKLK